MSKGYPVIVKISLPPNKQYQSGSSLLIQGESIDDVEQKLDQLCGTEGNGKVVLAAFAEEALGTGAVAVISKPSDPTPAAPAAPAEEEADPNDEPATPQLLGIVAKKTGKALEDLKGQGLTKAQAKALLKEVKK